MVQWKTLTGRTKRLFQTRLKSKKEKWDDIMVLILFLLVPSLVLIATFNPLVPQPVTPVYPKPNHHDRNIAVTLNFYSATFGATDRVYVYITIKPDDISKQEYFQYGTHDTPLGIGLPKYYYLTFQGSLCDSELSIFQDMYKQMSSCQIRVPYVESEQVYKNNAYFTYPVSGLYHVTLSDTELQSGTLNTEIPGFVKIDSLDSYLAYKTNKLLLILTLIGTYVAGVGVYMQWRESI